MEDIEYACGHKQQQGYLSLMERGKTNKSWPESSAIFSHAVISLLLMPYGAAD